MISSTSEHGQELITGLHLKHNPGNGFAVLRLHYTADPGKNPATARGQEWMAAVRKKFPENHWNREFEIDFLSHVGKRVCPDFKPKVHIRDGLEPHPDYPIYRGWDPGIRAAACVIGQIVKFDKGRPQVRIFYEYPWFQAAYAVLRDKVVADCDEHYKGRQFYDDQDVAGRTRDLGGTTALRILGEKGIAPRDMGSKPDKRAMLINHLLISQTYDAQPCFLIHPRCTRIISGMRGLYRFKETKSGRSTDKIDDTEIVHLFDAMGYMIYNNLHLEFQRRVAETEEKRHSFYLDEVMNAGKKKAKSWLNC
jgi:hypothetical protein